MFKNGQIQNEMPFKTKGYTSANVYPLMNENSCLVLRNPEKSKVIKLNHLGDPLAKAKITEQEIEDELKAKISHANSANLS